MARGLCSTLSPDDATSYFEQDSFLISSQMYGLISARKHYLDKTKVLFSEAKKSVFGKISIRVPSHFVQFITLFASLASYFRAEHLNFPW